MEFIGWRVYRHRDLFDKVTIFQWCQMTGLGELSPDPDLLRRCQRLPDLPSACARLVAQIPLGHVTTYGDLARYLGLAAASRWVGGWSLNHRHGPACCCHRIVRSTGEVGRHICWTENEKAAQLGREGIDVSNRGLRVSLEQHRWHEFRGPQPLRDLCCLPRTFSPWP